VLNDFSLNELNNKSVLITGANGLIASFLVDCIMHYNLIYGGKINVIALCRNKEKALTRFDKYINHPLMTFVFSDVCEPVNNSINYEYIIHAASNAHPSAYVTNPADTMKTNLLGTLNLLESAVKQKVKKFIFISSGEVYGINDSSEEKPLDELYFGNINISQIRSSYPESKRAAEVLCLAYKEQFGLDIVIARPYYVYGPTMTKESTKADAQFLRNALNGENILLKSEGNSIRSYCYVSDCANAIFRILLLGNNGAYNITGADNVSIKKFAEIAASTAGTKVIYDFPAQTKEFTNSAMSNAILSGAKIKTLGYKPKVSIYDGISMTMGILKYINTK